MGTLFPIIDQYPLFSNKQQDYLRLKEILQSGAVRYAELSAYVRPITPITTTKTILESPYFESWLVGFIEAEGCFSVYEPTSTKENSKVASFDIAQTNAPHLMEAIKKKLSFTQKILKDKTNCYKIKVSSVRSIENVVSFLKKAPVKLKGFKRLQYILFLKELRQIPRYNTRFRVPDRY